ncbi:HoxN/HupN/NixA family nickel/cobalt transporter [Collibacillus ludicampi]|uniref:Nickel/cobalt efflux system n=2 Tax=Collibacillus ludicampi TaxID=2771369 RepID=A0AAV4LCK8_9BACL|nr:HoxN/HupN/NixA family nickel/cobalt transporter [Collibacillus ludicampi]
MLSRMKSHPLFGYGMIIIGLHIFGLLSLFLVARNYPALFGIGFLAYTLGLRHAFDADHIAAIDNTVRKLIQDRKEPSGVGLFFSLGHSTVVFLLTLLTTITVGWVQTQMPYLKEYGELIGTTVSGSFLLFIGIINLLILVNICKAFSRMYRGIYEAKEIERLLLSRGFLSRYIGRFFHIISQSWHVYPLGFLFGLGFDTASEIALLAISAGAVEKGVPLLGILSLPILFAAGMSLMDTADEVFMTKAYGWAFQNPLRKMYFNLVVTALSVVSALLIGLVELTQALIPHLGLKNVSLSWLENFDVGGLGYYLVLLFVVSWVCSYGMWKLLRLEERGGS